MVKRKIKVKKLTSAIELITCANCKYFLRAEGDRGFCLKRIAEVRESYKCAKPVAGKPITELTPAQKEKLLKKFAEFDLYVKSVLETYDTFKRLIEAVYEDGEQHGRYKVVNKEVERRQLDTAKVRELLTKLGNIDEYYKTVRYKIIRVIDAEKYSER